MSPVFLCGASRSGTTVFGLMMRGHPGIVHGREMNFLFEEPIREDGADLTSYRRMLHNDRVFRTSGLQADPKLPHRKLIRSFVKAVQRDGKPLVINLHRNFQRVPEVFPNARYIHLLRDPRDVASSTVKMGWAGNVFFGVDHWINTEHDFDELYRRIDPERVLTLRHSALILDPVNELTRVCEFLGVQYHPGMLDYPRTSTYAAPDVTLVDKWKRSMTPRQLGLIEGKLGEMLTERGFEPSGQPIFQPRGLKREVLKWRNRAGRVGFSVRRYGAFWTFVEIAARRLGIRSLAERAQLAIDNRTLAYLK